MDIDKIRATTPGLSEKIHFNNAGCSFPDNKVFEAITNYMDLEKRVDGYKLQFDPALDPGKIYDLIARLVNARPDEIALTGSASDSIIRLLNSIPFKAGDRIITSSWEYGTNYLNYMWLRDKMGVYIDVVQPDPNGDLNLEELKNFITDNTKLISITHVPTSSGVVADVEAIGKIASEASILYHIDACQSVGQIPVDVSRMKCDFLSATSRKYLRGPRGLGFLYVRESILDQLEFHNINMIAAKWTAPDAYTFKPEARNFEVWEKPFAVIKGLEMAIQLILEIGIEHIWNRVRKLSDYFRSGIQKIEHLELFDRGSILCGIISLRHKSLNPESLFEQLNQENITTSISYDWASFTELNAKHTNAVNRLSIHYYNTYEEIDRCLEVLARS